MNIVPKRTCVRIRSTVRKIGRHPIVRSGRLLRKHVVRSATLGLVPDTLNDVAFHHAQLNTAELLHVLQDTVSITTMTTLLAALLVTVKE